MKLIWPSPFLSTYACVSSYRRKAPPRLKLANRVETDSGWRFEVSAIGSQPGDEVVGLLTKFAWLILILFVFVACSDTADESTQLANSTAALTTATAIPVEPGEWASIAPMKVGRADHSTILLDDGRVLVVGGLGDIGTLRSVEIFDPVLGEWVVAADTVHPRRDSILVKLTDGRVIAAGGQQSQTISTAEIYDPETNEWVELPDLNVGRQSGNGVALDDGRALVFGGGNGVIGGHDAQFELRSAEIYDPETNEWTLTEPTEQGEVEWSGWAKLSDGRVLLAGGGFARPNKFVQIFDPATDSWNISGTLEDPIGGGSAHLLPDGRVLLTGGGLRCCLTQTLIFDPGLETWSEGPEMPTARGGHKGVDLPDGRLLLLFGLNPDRPFDDIYLDGHVYNPANGQWLRTGEYPGRLTSVFRPLALNDGSVLLAGGRRTFLGSAGEIEVEFLQDTYSLRIPDRQ